MIPLGEHHSWNLYSQAIRRMNWTEAVQMLSHSASKWTCPNGKSVDGSRSYIKETVDFGNIRHDLQLEAPLWRQREASNICHEKREVP